MGTHLQEFSSYPSEVPTDYHKVASANPGVICEMQHLVESACKWLIQQRFKGVGMRWSEAGFNHLLHLRLAWVNQRFDSFFPDMEPSPN